MVVRFKTPGERPVRPAVRVIVVDPCKDMVLLCKRLCKRTGDLISYDFPGGGIETDETIEAAAIKECLEEVGVRVRDPKTLDVVATYPFDPKGGDWYYIYSGGMDHYVLATFEKYDSTKFHIEGDSMSYDWVPLTDVVRMIKDGPECPSNPTRLKALDKVVKMFTVYG